jgi:hypothetical protein
MVAIILAILSSLNASSYFAERSATSPEETATTTGAALDPALIVILVVAALVLLFGVLIIGSIVAGIFAYTSAEIANNREVTFRQAARATFDRLWSFVWLQVLTGIKVLLWTLLFIVPGIIMAVRYSLANVSFFDANKQLTGNAAIKDSLALTKGAWLTTFSTQMFFNIITLGLISPIIDTGSKAMLYRQFVALQKSHAPQQKPHALAWVTLGFTLLVAVGAIALLGFAIVNYGLSIIEG